MCVFMNTGRLWQCYNAYRLITVLPPALWYSGMWRRVTCHVSPRIFRVCRILIWFRGCGERRNILPVPLWATCNPRYTQFPVSKYYVGPSYSGACVFIFATNTADNVNLTYVKSLEWLKFLLFLCSLSAPSTHKEAANFDVLLTVHLSVFILAINQLDAQNLFYSKFISRLCMFRAPCAHRQEVKILLYSLW